MNNFAFHWLWENVTTERVKTAAALIQSFAAYAVIGAAVLAYWLNKRLEDHKFQMKLKEITVTNTHKRRLEALEKIGEFMGRLLFDLWSFLPLPVWSHDSPVSQHAEHQELTEYYKKFYEQRKSQFDESLDKLFCACEGGFIYLPRELYRRLTEFRTDCTVVASQYRSNVRERSHDSDYSRGYDSTLRDQCRNLQDERDKIIQMIKDELRKADSRET